MWQNRKPSKPARSFLQAGVIPKHSWNMPSTRLCSSKNAGNSTRKHRRRYQIDLCWQGLILLHSTLLYSRSYLRCSHGIARAKFWSKCTHTHPDTQTHTCIPYMYMIYIYTYIYTYIMYMIYIYIYSVVLFKGHGSMSTHVDTFDVYHCKARNVKMAGIKSTNSIS